MNSKEIKRLRLRIEGVTCASCTIPIRQSLEKVRGIKSVIPNYLLNLIIVYYFPDDITVEEIIELIRKSGYTAIPIYQ